MPEFRANFVGLRFDLKAWTKSLQDQMLTTMRMAAREWLREVIPHVPVQTGMARATLIPLGRYLHVGVPISPIKPPSKTRNIGLGQNMTQTDGFFLYKGGEFLFTFQSNVPHYDYNEFNASNFSTPIQTPWLSFEAGKKAFVEYIRSYGPKAIPSVKQFIYAVKIDG